MDLVPLGVQHGRVVLVKMQVLGDGVDGARDHLEIHEESADGLEDDMLSPLPQPPCENATHLDDEAHTRPRTRRDFRMRRHHGIDNRKVPPQAIDHTQIARPERANGALFLV